MQKKFKKNELVIEHVKGSGKGGQNRNKRLSGVRVEHKPSGIIVRATERRSQSQNLGNAIERLVEKIEVANYRPKKRLKTHQTRSSVEKRITHKKKRSALKKGRSSKSWD